MQDAIKIKKAVAILRKHKWVQDPHASGVYLKDVDDLRQYIKTAEAAGTQRHSLETTLDAMSAAIAAKSDAIIAELTDVLGDQEAKALTYMLTGGFFTPLSPKRQDVRNVAVYGWLAEAAIKPGVRQAGC